MPELPEVETILRALKPRVVGRRVLRFEATWPRQILPSLDQVRARLVGRAVRSAGRRGKQLVFSLDDGTHLLVHLRMSGRFEWRQPGESDPRHVRAELVLDDGETLLFCDARKFGRLRHVDDLEAATASLGPEPLEDGFTVELLAERLAPRHRLLKPLLLDQSFVAGLGNIYTDEALFRAGLHPERLASDLTADEVGRLHEAIRNVLELGIEQCGTSLDWIYPGGHMQDYLQVYGRRGERCPRCGEWLRRIVVGQRSTHLCLRCQPTS